VNGRGTEHSDEDKALRNELIDVVLPALCPLTCGYRISSGGMWVDKDGKMHSEFKQGGPCSVHMSSAKFLVAAILPVVVRDRARQQELIDKVRALHYAVHSEFNGKPIDPPWCEHCVVPWPCETVRILDGETHG
jgi:hypothetical protein